MRVEGGTNSSKFEPWVYLLFSRYLTYNTVDSVVDSVRWICLFSRALAFAFRLVSRSIRHRGSIFVSPAVDFAPSGSYHFIFQILVLVPYLFCLFMYLCYFIVTLNRYSFHYYSDRHSVYNKIPYQRTNSS